MNTKFNNSIKNTKNKGGRIMIVRANLLVIYIFKVSKTKMFFINIKKINYTE